MLKISSRTDMHVQAAYGQSQVVYALKAIFELRMPDSMFRVGTACVGLTAMAVSKSGVILFIPVSRMTFFGPNAMAATRLPVPSRLTSLPSRVMALVLAIMMSLITWVPGLALFCQASYFEGAGWFGENLRIAVAIFITSWAWIFATNSAAAPGPEKLSLAIIA